MRCKKPDGNYSTVAWKYFLVSCSRINLSCNASSGAWVAAVTVCNQRLF